MIIAERTFKDGLAQVIHKESVGNRRVYSNGSNYGVRKKIQTTEALQDQSLNCGE